MALNIIRLGPEYIPDPTKGKPISNAKIFIGEPDKAPQLFPKTVSLQQESGAVVQIVQPVLTGAGGIPLYNGSPVSMYVDGDYSMQILDSSDNQVYYIPSMAADPSGSLPSVKRELIVSTAGQTVFTLSNAYTPGTDSLMITDNGSLVPQTDYAETDSLTVTFVSGIPVGHDIEFVSGGVSTATIEATAVGYTPPGSTTTTNVAEKLSEIVSVKDHGAVGDGVTDDTTAIQAAYDSISTSGGVYYPTGVYLKTSPTTWTDKAISSYGDGSSSSIIKCVGTDGFTINNNTLSDKESVSFESLGFEASENGIRTAIDFDGQTTSALGKQLSIRYCSFSGTSNSLAWKIPLNMANANFSEVLYSFFRGNTSDRTKMTSVIQLTDSTDCKFIGNSYYWADVAINITGFAEGLTVRDSHFVPVNIGFRHTGTGNLVWICDNHISAYTNGVVIGSVGVNGVNHSHVKGNLIFKNSLSSNNFNAISVHGKKADISGNEVLIPSGPAGGTQNGIVLNADAAYTRVIGNQIANMDTAILIQTLSTDNTIVGNTFLSNTSDITDNGSNSDLSSNQRDNSTRISRATLTSLETIPNNSLTIIDWDAANKNTQSMWVIGAPSRLTIPAGVKQVKLSTNIKWASDSTGERMIEILKDGAATSQGLASDRRISSLFSDSNIITGWIDVSGGDYFEVRVFQTSGGNLDIQNVGQTWFEVELA